MKKWIALFLTLVMLMALAACGSDTADDSGTSDSGNMQVSDTGSGEEETSGEEESYLFGVSARTFSSPYFVTICDQIQALGTENTEFMVSAADDDVTKQLTAVEDMIQSGCDVILICPVNSSAIKPALKSCQDADIPVVVFDSRVDDEDMVACTVVSDNYVCGFQCGEALAEAIGYKGDVAEYVDVSQQIGIERATGWRDAIAQYPDIHIVNTQEGAGDSPSAVPKMEAILEANPDIVGMFAFNDPSGNGCISAIAAAGKTGQIKVVSIDGLDMALESITKGEQYGTSMQRTDLIAESAMNAAYQLVAGETPEHEIVLDPTWVDSTNVEEFYTPAS